MIRSVIAIIYHSFLRSPTKHDLSRVGRFPFIVMPWHLDLNFHLNNAQYLSFCNQARLAYLSEFKILKILRAERLTPVIYKADIRYLKSLKPFDLFYIESSFIEVEQNHITIKHDFMKNGQKMAEIICGAKLLDKSGTIDHHRLFGKYFTGGQFKNTLIK